MIAKLTLSDDVVAILNDKGEWESDDEVVTLHLNRWFNPDDDDNVMGFLPYGVGAALNAAKATGGSLDLGESLPPAGEDEEEGMVY